MIFFAHFVVFLPDLYLTPVLGTPQTIPIKNNHIKKNAKKDKTRLMFISRWAYGLLCEKGRGNVIVNSIFIAIRTQPSPSPFRNVVRKVAMKIIDLFFMWYKTYIRYV